MARDSDSRLALARQLRELADGSSEAALRAALSRSYYSIFHAAKVLLDDKSDKVVHTNIAQKLSVLDAEMGRTVQRLHQLRSWADYDPDIVEREFKGSGEQFRLEVRKRLDEGRAIFERLEQEILKKGL